VIPSGGELCLSAQRNNLNYNQKLAIESLKRRLAEENYPVGEYIVFGSVARGEATEDSDLDLLALTLQPLSHRLKHSIYGIVTEINLEFNTNISLLIVDKYSWDNGMYSIMSIKNEVEQDGVRI